MSLIARRQPPLSEARSEGVMAYVTDDRTGDVLQRCATALSLPHFELRRGGVQAAERDLRTQRSPALLFVDVGDVEMVVAEMQKLADVCEPQTHVVVIGDRNDVGLYRELLRLGAADYLFRPLYPALVETLMRRLIRGEDEVRTTARLGKLVVVLGARGGVGASSVACNLASYLADRAARRVALLDMDTTTGAQALLLNAIANPGLAEALMAPGRLDDLLLERAMTAVSPRLDLLASEQPLERSPAPSAAACEALIDRLRATHHYVIVDVGHQISPATEYLTAAAALQLLVTEATILSVRDALRHSERIAGGLTAPGLMLVHSKAGRPGDLSQADLSAALRRDNLVRVPFQPHAFGQGVNMGVPAWTTDKRVEGAIERMVRQLSGQGDAAPRAGTLLMRLRGLVP